MPLYTYSCEDCGLEHRKLISVKDKTETIPCTCGAEAKYNLPTVGETSIMEMRDAHRGKQLPKNHERIMKKRYTEHHDRHDLEEKIDKFGLEEAERHGWTRKIKRI